MFPLDRSLTDSLTEAEGGGSQYSPETTYAQLMTTQDMAHTYSPRSRVNLSPTRPLHGTVGVAWGLVFLVLSSIHLAPCMAAPVPTAPTPVSTALEANPLMDVVNSLLSSLLKETLYRRMENLLLDPGRSARNSVEKQKIVESAVENYQHQDMSLADDPTLPPAHFSRLAGYWIRETPEPSLLPSKGVVDLSRLEDEETSTDTFVDYKTEVYSITDLFASSEDPPPIPTSSSPVQE